MKPSLPILSKFASKNGFSVRAYLGDGAVLLAFNLSEDKLERFAGFAIECIAPTRGPYANKKYWLKNMLSHKKPVTSGTEMNASRLTDSNKAPFQAFHWVHYPSAGEGTYQYVVYSCYFKNTTGIELRDHVGVEVDLEYRSFPGLEVAFTRGYISSQAYGRRHHNKNIEPKPKSIDFDTKEYEEQYMWLGAHARRILFDFLNECKQDTSVHIDVFAYDFDEPDIIGALCSIADRVRVVQDNSDTHSSEKDMEQLAIKKLKAAGAKVVQGRFQRLQHNKVFIKKKNGEPVKVLTGSANFSIRGLYVQANSVLIFDDPEVAKLYEAAFENAFVNATKNFKQTEIASKWFEIVHNDSRPDMSVSFAPHNEAFTVDTIADAIEAAKSSVFFAIMQMNAGGSVMPAIRKLKDRDKILSLGTTETKSELKMFRPGLDDNAAIVTFDYLHRNVPKPFREE